MLQLFRRFPADGFEEVADIGDDKVCGGPEGVGIGGDIEVEGTAQKVMH